MNKVLFIIDTLGFGGAEKHVVSLLNNLNIVNNQYSLVYLKPVTGLLDQVKQERLNKVFCANVTKKVDVKVIKELAIYLEQEEIDIVFCTNNYPLFFGMAAKFMSKRKPKIIEVYHTTVLLDMKSKLQMLLYRLLFNRADKLVYVCENQRKYWRNRGILNKHDAVIYNGIDVEYFTNTLTISEKKELRARMGFADTDFIVGICAVLRPEKCHSDLLQAVVKLHAAGVSAKCLIIGEGPERPKIEQEIKLLNLQDHIVITGFQSDVRSYVSICDAMAIVSHSVETFSMSALESMALSKPVVMSQIGGADEMVDNNVNGFVYEVGNIDKLTECLQILSDPNVSTTMGQAARRIVCERFALSTMIDKYEKLLIQ